MTDNSEFVRFVSRERVWSKRNYVRASRVHARGGARIPADRKNLGAYTYFTVSKKVALDMMPSRVIVVSDGSWESEYGVRNFRQRRLEVECLTWKHCAEFYRSSLPELTTWAEKHIWGKKMACILYLSETDRVLFSAPDVLWYGDPLTAEEWSTTKFKVSEDCCHSCDKDFIKNTASEYLYDTEQPINCGVVYIHGGLKLLNDKALDCIRYQADHCGDFAEKIVFAIMDLQYNNRWTGEEIVSAIDDVVQPLFSKTVKYSNSVARHYLWYLKWIYWTEYFKMRCF